MGEVAEIPAEVEAKFQRADALDRRAREIREEALAELKERSKRFVREMEDKILNRSQCLEYLSIGTLESLKNWERKYRPYGYLQFEDNKILRSDLLRFIDDLNSGTIEQKMRA